MSKLYPEHKALESYFKEKGNLASYYGFLLLHYNTIVTSSLPTNNWKELNNQWINHFLIEAKHQIINEEFLISIKEKKDSVKRKLEEEKENFNSQSKKCRTTITLFCIVQGNAHNAFAININKNKTISELKSLIQKEKHNDFAGIDPDQLKLWQCSLDNERNPNFKLSKPMVIIYGDEDMEDRVKKVLGHIVWLLGEAQRLDELEDKN
ncbi:5097_t:CDS:2 [Rhizophagus irregularis]|nr:5097_t:CDS:2 [Rhizophagus irregularis]